MMRIAIEHDPHGVRIHGARACGRRSAGFRPRGRTFVRWLRRALDPDCGRWKGGRASFPLPREGASDIADVVSGLRIRRAVRPRAPERRRRFREGFSKATGTNYRPPPSALLPGWRTRNLRGMRRALGSRVEESGMAYAWPLALRDVDAGARAFRSKRTWLRAVVPAALVCAGALLLSPPWRNAPSAASAAPPAVNPAPLLPASGGGDPMALVGALLVVGGALALLPSILSRLQARRSGGGLIDVVEVRPLGRPRSLVLVQ